MDRKVLKKMTAKELIELVERQTQAINSLDMQRYDANAVIEHLVIATENMKNLRYHDIERKSSQEYLDDYVRQMYMKYPTYLAPVVKKERKCTYAETGCGSCEWQIDCPREEGVEE